MNSKGIGRGGGAERWQSVESHALQKQPKIVKNVVKLAVKGFHKLKKATKKGELKSKPLNKRETNPKPKLKGMKRVGNLFCKTCMGKRVNPYALNTKQEVRAELNRLNEKHGGNLDSMGKPIQAQLSSLDSEKKQLVNDKKKLLEAKKKLSPEKKSNLDQKIKLNKEKIDAIDKKTALLKNSLHEFINENTLHQQHPKAFVSLFGPSKGPIEFAKKYSSVEDLLKEVNKLKISFHPHKQAFLKEISSQVKLKRENLVTDGNQKAIDSFRTITTEFLNAQYPIFEGQAEITTYSKYLGTKSGPKAFVEHHSSNMNQLLDNLNKNKDSIRFSQTLLEALGDKVSKMENIPPSAIEILAKAPIKDRVSAYTNWLGPELGIAQYLSDKTMIQTKAHLEGKTGVNFARILLSKKIFGKIPPEEKVDFYCQFGQVLQKRLSEMPDGPPKTALKSSAANFLKTSGIHKSKNSVEIYSAWFGAKEGGRLFRDAFDSNEELLAAMENSSSFVQTKSKEFVRSMLFDGQTPRPGSKDLVLKSLEQEVTKQTNLGAFLRGNSVASQLMATYIQHSMQPVVQEMLGEDFLTSLEKKPPISAENAVLMLYMGLNNAIEDRKIPPHLIEFLQGFDNVCNTALANARANPKMIVKEHHITTLQNNAFNQFMLRAINPMLLRPSMVGLPNWKTPNPPRAAIDASDLMQQLINKPAAIPMKKFEGEKTPYVQDSQILKILQDQQTEAMNGMLGKGEPT